MTSIMYRPVALTVVVLSAAVACSAGHAASLYRWAETDGSLTYSPTPPPSGIDYQIVDSRTLKPSAAHDEAARAAANPASASPVNPAPLRYAPAVQGPGSGESGQSLAQRAANRPLTQPLPTAELPVSTQTVRASNKLSQCRDLRKRVVSLERRLRSPLSATDMDNTVLQMARYQKSVDQFCLD